MVAQRLGYDPECYLCPGNSRVGGAENPGYDNTFVFTNDFAALNSDPTGDRKKFMVGYDMLAEPQSDLTAETATEILRNVG